MTPREEELAAMVNARLEQRKSEGNRQILANLSAGLACLVAYLAAGFALRFLLGYAGIGTVMTTSLANIGAITLLIVTVLALFPRPMARALLLRILVVFIGGNVVILIQGLFHSSDEATDLAATLAAPAITAFVALAVTIWLYQRQKRAEEDAEREQLRQELRAARARR